MVTSAESSTADREIVLTRVFDAPRRLVWKAWTELEHVGRWWGPQGFTTTTKQRELKPGGVWRYTMHGPDGRDYPNLITFLEVVEFERLSYKHGGEGDTAHINFQATVTFEEEGSAGERTKLTMRSVFPSAKALEFVVREVNAIEGGKQHLGRLAEHLATMRPAEGAATDVDRPFVITRVFRAPREIVWKAWTEADALARWFGPKTVTLPHCTLDLREGGTFHYCMRPAEGPDSWGKWVFREIVKPDRLVFVVSFADEAGRAIRAPFDETWPLEMLSKVTFSEHAGFGHGTVVTIEWTPHNPTEAERRTFAAGHDGMRQGWTGTLDRLAEVLADS